MTNTSPSSKWELFEGATERGNITIEGVPDGTRIVVVSDAQVPLEDRALLRTIFDDFVPSFKPVKQRGKPAPEYHLFLNGDILDAFTLSRYLARVNVRFTLGDEVEMVRHYLAEWGREFSHRHFVMGNHEDRWDREIYAGNRQFARFTKPLHEVLGLDDKEWDWVPYLRHYDFEGFIITHGDVYPRHVAAKMLENYKASGTSGHVNRPQDFTWTDAAKGEAATWYTTGMTCREDIGDIISDWRRIQPWAQGFLIGEVQGGVLYVQNIRVHHGHFYAGGQIWEILDA